VCGFRCGKVEPYLRPAPEKHLDKRYSRAYYVEEVRAMVKPMTPEELRRLRLSLDMSQQDFSQFLGVTVMSVSRWENGHVRISRPWSFFIRSQVKEHKEKYQPA
jgi:DNA-binding transcriptional regulator YiaG